MQGGRSARQIEGLDLVIGVASSSGPRPSLHFGGDRRSAGLTGAGEGFRGRQLNVDLVGPDPPLRSADARELLSSGEALTKPTKPAKRDFAGFAG